jgi:hypothetical protein
MKATTNRALAEQQAVRDKLRGFRDTLLMREAVASAKLSEVEAGTADRNDEPEEPRDGR